MEDYVSNRGQLKVAGIDRSTILLYRPIRWREQQLASYHSLEENKLLSCLLRDCFWLRVQKCRTSRSNRSDSILAIAHRTMEIAIKTKLFVML